MFARRKPIKHPPVRPFGFDVGFLRHFFRTTPVHWPQGAERVLTLVGSADYSCAPGVMRNLVVQALDRGMGVWHFGCKDPKSVHYLSQQADKKSLRELHFGGGRIHLFNPIYGFEEQEIIEWCQLALSPKMNSPGAMASEEWRASVLRFWSALVPLLVEGERLKLWDRGLKRIRHVCSISHIKELIDHPKLSPQKREVLSQWLISTEASSHLLQEAYEALGAANVQGFEDGIADFDALSAVQEQLRVMVSVPYGIGRNGVNLRLTNTVMSAMIVAMRRNPQKELSHLVVIDSPSYVLSHAELLTQIAGLGNVACVVVASIEDEISVLHDATTCLADLGPVLSLGRNTKGSLRKGNHRQHLIVSPLEDASLGKIQPMISQGSYRATHLASQLSDLTLPASSFDSASARRL